MIRHLKYGVFLFAVLLLSCAKTDAQEVRHVSPKEAHNLIANDTNVFLLDVRTEGEYMSETGHLPDAHLIPVDELESRIAEVPRSKKVIAYCRSGNRSATAAEILAQKGISASTMDGGIIQWVREGYEVEKSAQ